MGAKKVKGVFIPENPAQLKKILNDKKLVLLECYTGMSKTCERNKDLMKTIKSSNKETCSSGVTFVRAMTTHLQKVIEEFSVESYPVYIFFRDGHEVDRFEPVDLAEVEVDDDDDDDEEEEDEDSSDDDEDDILGDVQEKSLPDDLLKTKLEEWLGQVKLQQ